MGWLPEGYELVESDAPDRVILRRYIKSSSGVKSSIDVRAISFFDEGVFKVDTEADQIYQVSVQNTLATVIQKEECVQITWMYPKSNCIVTLYGDNISTETALRIAQSIVLS